MEPVIYIIIGIVVVAIIAAMILHKKKQTSSYNANVESTESDLETIQKGNLARNTRPELKMKFEDLPSLTESEEAGLIEIKDQKLLARIDSVVPGTLKAMANAGVANQYQQSVQKAGQLYQAIIPQGAVLADSKAMEGAVRGIYHGADGIAGHANLVAVDGNMGKGLAAMNAANATMSVAAMVVGQYYMTQINDQLGDINSELDKIATFQDKEYQSRIYALVAAVQNCSQFQLEIIDNEELRHRELNHLKDQEDECAKLLGQANLTIKEFEKKKELKYSNYEKLVIEAQTWYQYQQVLLEVMLKIEELTYALNLGKVSKENCYSMFLPYANQAHEALRALESWHKENGAVLQIDLDASRRRRQGFLWSILAFFNDDLKYKDVSKSTVAMITKQSSDQSSVSLQGEKDLFREDVRLIAKDGKLYYLPESDASSE